MFFNSFLPEYRYLERQERPSDSERYEYQTAHIARTMDAIANKERKQMRYNKAQRQK